MYIYSVPSNDQVEVTHGDCKYVHNIHICVGVNRLTNLMGFRRSTIGTRLSKKCGQN